jgi:hypothetical protein
VEFGFLEGFGVAAEEAQLLFFGELAELLLHLLVDLDQHPRFV